MPTPPIGAILKTIKVSISEIKQTHLESYKNKTSTDTIYEIKEKPRGRGLGVFAAKILQSGEIDFYFFYFVDGKRKSKKIGRYGTGQGRLTLAKAKAEFRELSSTYSSGTDPKEKAEEEAKKLLDEKLALQETERKKQMQGSVRQLAEYYLDYLKQNKGETHYNNVKKALRHDLSQVILETKASDVTKAHIIQILHPIVERGALIMANRMKAYLSAMFQYGITFDDSIEAISKNTQFFIQSNPVLTVQKIVKNEKKGERFLSESEVRQFWIALDTSSMSPLRANVFKLMLITGCRLEEIAGLQWSEIDYTDKTITLLSSRTKNKIAHIVPLSALAIEILRNTPKVHEVYVFPAQNNAEHMQIDGFSQAISRLLSKVEIEKFVPRDLRRTFKTLTGKAGITKDIRDRLQNHALQDVSSLHYDRYDYLKEKRAAMETWNDYLVGILNKNSF